MQRIRIPQIKDIAAAIRIYYSRLELENDDIRELFPGVSNSKIANLKKPVLENMNKNGILRYGYHSINTQAAFEVWGLDIKDLEKRLSALNRLNMLKGVETNEKTG